ncbi:retinol dehydrogenase 16 isoform X2 [Macaca fascicularis]|uniref:retinol dehydrogenase 16 isoform X2 n=1 Tax=Macaca fascicularis TaxID=9541 RepID=UPI003D15B542
MKKELGSVAHQLLNVQPPPLQILWCLFYPPSHPTPVILPSLYWDVSCILTVHLHRHNTVMLSHLPTVPGLWGLVNNAGISLPAAPNELLTKQDFVTVLDVNLLGVIDVTLSLLPLVRKARGRVVNVSSICGRVSLFGGGYCISKYGVEAFSDSLRRELSYFGVKVAMIEPGYFKTAVTSKERFLKSFLEIWDQSSPEVKEVCSEKILAVYKKFAEQLEQKYTQDLSLVTNCMEHALIACHPRTHYSAGWDAKLLYLPMSYMPTFLVDAIIYWDSANPAKAL